MPALSIRLRALLAVALFVGFYVIALAIAAGLLAIPYLEYQATGNIIFRVGIFCVLGAIAILRGIMPRRDRFEPPGPPLRDAEQPRLFAVIRDIAAQSRQAMPSDVYLAPEVNAFVAQRDGILGFGSRRVMGIGLPLLQATSIDEFRAVIAHEFGHYDAGDTALGPWIYQTRAAIERTLFRVSQHSSILSAPFKWYGIAFVRVTHAISRRQEFTADALAARIVGADHTASALQTIERAGAGFGAFWQQEMSPTLNAGYRPPVAAGFAQFLAAPRIATSLDEYLTHQLHEGKQSSYDTHPVLRERLAALGSTSRTSDLNAPRATTLIDDLARVEGMLIQSVLKKGTPEPKPIEWTDVGVTVYPRAWIKVAKPSLSGLDSLNPAILPEIAARLRTDPDALVRQLGVPRDAKVDPELPRAHARAVLESAVALAFDNARRARAGSIELTAPVGEPIRLHIVDRDPPIVFEPFGVVAALSDRSLSTADWNARIDAAGVAGANLGAAVRTADAQGVMVGS